MIMTAEAIEWLDGIAARLRKERESGSSPRGERTTGRDLLSRFGYAPRPVGPGRDSGGAPGPPVADVPRFRVRVGRQPA